MPGKRPSFVRWSLKQMPQAWTLMRTWPGPGCGISRSTISKSPPALGTWTAFIFAMREDLSMRLILQVGCEVNYDSYKFLFANSAGGAQSCFQLIITQTCEEAEELRILAARPNGR